MKKHISFWMGCFVLIAFTIAFIVYRVTKDTSTTTRDLAFKEWKFLPKRKIVIAEISGTASIHYELQKWGVFEQLGKLSKYAPGERSVDADGKLDLVIGYDSTVSLLSNDATTLQSVRNDTLYFLVKTRFPQPVILYSSIKTLPAVTKSLFAKDIQDKDFFAFLDSAAKADGAEILADQNQRSQLIASYCSMTAEELYLLFKKEHPDQNIVIRVQVDGNNGYLPIDTALRINKNISISKKVIG